MFCPECGTWNRARAVRCTRCTTELPELAEEPRERPDEELTALRRITGSRYRVIRRLGSGGMANVYYAEHQLLERALVIKVLHAHLARDAEMRERFRREAESASQLVHPHICTIIDYAEAAEAVFIVMPYLAGGSLADVLVKERTVSAGPAMAVCAQIATARFHGRLTGTGRAMGTPHYMSPEQAMGKMVDGRSDIYAVGVMLYEMLLGFPPFDGADSYSVGYKHVHETAAAPDVVDSRVSPELSALIMRCLSKAADARFQTGAELADALLAFLIAMGSAAETRSAWFARRGGGAPATPL